MKNLDKSENTIINKQTSIIERTVKASVLLMSISIYSFPDYNVISYITRILFIFVTLIYLFKKPVIVFRGYWGWICSFSFVCMLNVLFSINKQLTLSAFFLTMQAVWIGYLLTIWLYNSREYKFIIFINAISIIPFLIRAYIHYSSFAWGTRRYSYLFGINTNSWGIRLAFAIAFAIMNIYYTKKNKLKVVFLVVVVASFVVILITGSRRSLLLSLMSFCVLLLGHNPSQIKKLKVSFVIIAVLLIVYRLVMFVPEFYTIVGSRIDEALTSFHTEGTVLDDSRNAMIEMGLNLFWDRPFTGWGLGTFGEVSGLEHPYCHNNYVELLFASGIIGFITYYSLLASIIVRGIKLRNNGKQLSAMIVLVGFVLISGYVTVDYTSLFNQLIISIILSISYLTSEKYNEVLIGDEKK